MTDYIILKAGGKDDSPLITVQGRVQATSSDSAIRKYLQNGGDSEGGNFAAVPARSLKFQKVVIEKAVKIGQ